MIQSINRNIIPRVGGGGGTTPGSSVTLPAAWAAQNRVQSVAATPGWTSVGAFPFHLIDVKGFKTITLEVVAFVVTTALQMRFRVIDSPTLTLVPNSLITIAAGSTQYQDGVSGDISAGLVNGTIYQIQMEVTGGALLTDFGTIGSGNVLANY